MSGKLEDKMAVVTGGNMASASPRQNGSWSAHTSLLQGVVSRNSMRRSGRAAKTSPAFKALLPLREMTE